MSPDLTDKPVNSTVPPGLDICLRGFADQNEAQSVGRLVGDGLRLLGQSLNLGGLEGVIVAHDYDEALASIDRGTETSAPLTRTNDDRATGMAMAPAVLRNGVVKHYIVLEANLAKCLIRSPDDQLFHMAVYTLAHEASHVHDVTARDRAERRRFLSASLTLAGLNMPPPGSAHVSHRNRSNPTKKHSADRFRRRVQEQMPVSVAIDGTEITIKSCAKSRASTVAC